MIQTNSPSCHIELSPEKCFGPAYGAVNVILQGLVTQRLWQAVEKDSIPAKLPQSSGQSELGSALLGALLLKDSLPPPESPHLLIFFLQDI